MQHGPNNIYKAEQKNGFTKRAKVSQGKSPKPFDAISEHRGSSIVKIIHKKGFVWVATIAHYCFNMPQNEAGGAKSCSCN